MSTADNHRARLMKKIGVKLSRELTILALRDGLIDMPKRRDLTIEYAVTDGGIGEI